MKYGMGIVTIGLNLNKKLCLVYSPRYADVDVLHVRREGDSKETTLEYTIYMT